jgi:hypothetical protein
MLVYCQVVITSISAFRVAILRYVSIGGRITGFSELKQEIT